MARLIIGHVKDSSASIWIRGNSEYPFAFVTVHGPGAPPNRTVALEERHFFTGVASVDGLRAGADYSCNVEFGRTSRQDPRTRVDFGHCSGRFRTPPRAGQHRDLTFLLGSCNLHSLGPMILPVNPAFERLSQVAMDRNADFMVHCGDQIYYDIPIATKAPDIDEYREKYLDAWKDSRAARKFLTEMPHYMILDDHEMVNNFTNDMDASKYGGATAREIRDASLKVYREFVHIRQPNSHGRQSLSYEFSHGRYRFFVMDTRSERWATGTGGRPSRMISTHQMRKLKAWLRANARTVKFIVTSVPFVGQVSDTDDKWCSAPYKRQREEIMKFLLTNGIEGVVFLTGDMHSSYHATLEISNEERSVMVHEFMSSPINQIGKRTLDRYLSPHSDRSVDGTFDYRSTVERRSFYGDHSNAMVLSASGRNIDWEIFRTKRRRRVRTGSVEV